MKICPTQLTARKITPIKGSSAGTNQTLAKPSQADLPPKFGPSSVQHQSNKTGIMVMSKRSKTPEAQKPGTPEARIPRMGNNDEEEEDEDEGEEEESRRRASEGR